MSEEDRIFEMSRDDIQMDSDLLSTQIPKGWSLYVEEDGQLLVHVSFPKNRYLSFRVPVETVAQVAELVQSRAKRGKVKQPGRAGDR
jgi:hypothetical protein